jgi:hypothetical protein
MTYLHLFNGCYHVQDHSGFPMDCEVIYDVECCVIKVAKLQKNNSNFFFGCEMEPPLFEFEIFTTLFKIPVVSGGDVLGI